MPRINDYIVDCSIYLYSTEALAREGSQSGGSGFLTHVVSKVNPSIGHVYAVTNKHVISGGCVVLRINRKAGGFDTIPTKYEDWHFHPEGDDVAALSIELSDDIFGQFRWWSVPTEMFITPEIIEAYRVGLGDEAFLVGRLIGHDGKQKNAPTVRFGNISLMADPSEPIRCDDSYGNVRDQEGFLVECRSLSGFSGSPVFVETTQVYRETHAQCVHEIEVKNRLIEEPPQSPQGMTITPVSLSGTWGPWLLGIDWGHIHMYRSVEENGEKRPDLRVDLNTGIACVLPAWKIMELLHVEELVKGRTKEDKRIAKQAAGEVPQEQ